MGLQTVLVLLTFLAATGYLLRKFIILPLIEKKKQTVGTIDGGNTKCGKKDCGCH